MLMMLMMMTMIGSNCHVIAAQITDYGLPSFLSGQNFDESEHDTFRRE